MLFSRDWLAQYLDLPPAIEESTAALTEVGLAVEGFERRGDDTILDVEVTTNRPDAMNHLGLARELATKLRRTLRLPAPRLRESAESAAAAVCVDLEPGCGALRYAVRVVRGVRVAPSPAWLQARLEAIGHRPVNNVVDVTNFVLWEMGQPLHAFDLERLAGEAEGAPPRIVVRRARAGEKLVTLDRVERALSPELLVIADARRPVALAGVMGGLESEVTATTTTVLIESAHFARDRVRATARAVGLKTDASQRFERGADPEACAAAADRAAALIAELAGGEILSGLVDVRAVWADWPAQWPPRGRLSRARLNAFAGVEYRVDEIESILGGLGFGLERTDADRWLVTVPSWRWYDIPPRADGTAGAPDVEEADLFEEVIRHGGFDRIPAALPALAGSDPGRSPAHDRRDRVRAALAGAGYAEAIHFAFHSREADLSVATLVPGGEPLALANPISELYAVMRRSLLPDLIASARANQRRSEAVRLFEVGHLFPAAGPEVEAVALIAGGRLPGGLTIAPGEVESKERQRIVDLRDLKGAVEDVLAALGVVATFEPASIHGLESGEGAEIRVDGKTIGILGRLAAAVFPAPLYASEILLEALPVQPAVVSARTPSRYPEVAADLTLTHADGTRWADIDKAIRERAVPDLAAFEFRGQYRGVGVPAGAVNTTIRFHYQAEDRSLTQEAVNERHLALATDLQRRFGLEESSAP